MRLTIIIMCFVYNSVFSQTITFNKRIAFGCTNTVLTSIETTDSCYYATGFARDYVSCNRSTVFAKIDTFGNAIFNTVIYDTLNIYETWEPSLSTYVDGNLVVSAYVTDSTWLRGGVLKYDHNGNMIWNSLHYSPYGVGHYIRTDDVRMTKDSGFIVMSNIEDVPPAQVGGDIGIMKLDKNGNQQWNITRGTNTIGERIPTVYVENNGTYVIGYQQDNLSSVQINYIVRSKLEKIDSVGGTIWTYQSPSNQQIHGVNDLIKSKDGGWVVASAWGSERLGANGTWSTPIQEAYVYKLDSGRNFLWGTKFHSDILTSANFTRILELEDSSLIAFGTVVRQYPQPNPTYYVIHGRIVKLSPQGDSLWSREYEYLSTQQAIHSIYDAERTYDGGFLVCGGADYTGSGPYQQGWLLKLDNHGCLVPGCHLALNTKPTPAVENMRMLLYPNPTTDYLNVFYQSEKSGSELKFSVIDMQGRILQNYTTLDVSDKTYIVPVYDLTTGIYVLEIRRDGQLLKSEQFIKN